MSVSFTCSLICTAESSFTQQQILKITSFSRPALKVPSDEMKVENNSKLSGRNAFLSHDDSDSREEARRVTQSLSWWHTWSHQVKTTQPLACGVRPAGIACGREACDALRYDFHAWNAAWSVPGIDQTSEWAQPCDGQVCLWKMLVRAANQKTREHQVHAGNLLTERLSSASFPWRQKTWWHQDERQARKRRNGAENWRKIKWKDKVGASEEKKTGGWIDCDRRERGRGGWEEWCSWYSGAAERRTPLFPLEALSEDIHYSDSTVITPAT